MSLGTTLGGISLGALLSVSVLLCSCDSELAREKAWQKVIGETTRVTPAEVADVLIDSVLSRCKEFSLLCWNLSAVKRQRHSDTLRAKAWQEIASREGLGGFAISIQHCHPEHGTYAGYALVLTNEFGLRVSCTQPAPNADVTILVDTVERKAALQALEKLEKKFGIFELTPEPDSYASHATIVIVTAHFNGRIARYLTRGYRLSDGDRADQCFAALDKYLWLKHQLP